MDRRPGHLRRAVILRKHPLIRASHYLFLLPFLPSLRPLLVHYQTADLIIYITGILLMTTLIVYGNHRPLLRIENQFITLYPLHGGHAEYHSLTDISDCRRSSSGRITIYVRKHEPVTLKLRKRDIEKLISAIER